MIRKDHDSKNMPKHDIFVDPFRLRFLHETYHAASVDTDTCDRTRTAKIDVANFIVKFDG